MADYRVATSKPDNPEHKALTMSYPKLVDCIARSPGDTTVQLVPFTIFSVEEMGDLSSTRLSDMDKARKIMNAVMSKVESEPSFLNNFICIIEKYNWMKLCTDELKRDLEAKKQTSQESTSASEFTTVKATRPTPVIPDTPSVDDIYTKISKREQSVSTKLDRSDLENRTNFIRRKFASVVTSVKMALKHTGVTTKDLTSHLSELESCCSDHINGKKALFFCEELIKQIQEKCKSDVWKVFSELKRYYSWINFGIIESIIDAFLRKDAIVQEQWTEYQSHYEEYCSERVCEIPKPLNGPRKLSKQQKSTGVIFKIDYGWNEIRFDRLNNIRADIIRLLKVQSPTLYLYTVEQGCVELVFEVPQHVADVIFPPTEEQLLALQEHNITYSGLAVAASDIAEDCIMVSKAAKDEIDLNDNKLWKDFEDRDLAPGVNMKKMRKEFNNAQSIKILVTGKTGTGKSSLVNGIIGSYICEVEEAGDELKSSEPKKNYEAKKAKESADLHQPGTIEVTEFETKIGEVSVKVWDSPGWHQESS